MIDSSLAQLGAALRAKKISSVELTQLYLDRINQLNPQLNAFITLNPEMSLAQARAADAASGRRHRRSADRHPYRAEGYLLRQGLAHDLRLEDAAQLRFALRCACD